MAHEQLTLGLLRHGNEHRPASWLNKPLYLVAALVLAAFGCASSQSGSSSPSSPSGGGVSMPLPTGSSGPTGSVQLPTPSIPMPGGLPSPPGMPGPPGLPTPPSSGTPGFPDSGAGSTSGSTPSDRGVTGAPLPGSDSGAPSTEPGGGGNGPSGQGAGGPDDVFDKTLEDLDQEMQKNRQGVLARANQNASEREPPPPPRSKPSGGGGAGGSEAGGATPGGASGGEGQGEPGTGLPDLPTSKSGIPDIARADPIPKDIPDARGDDAVAKQLREAAINEPDPALREKLWDEYRNYKKNTN